MKVLKARYVLLPIYLYSILSIISACVIFKFDEIQNKLCINMNIKRAEINSVIYVRAQVTKYIQFAIISKFVTLANKARHKSRNK